MKIFAKYHVCNHCVIGEKKNIYIYLSGPVGLRVYQLQPILDTFIPLNYF